MSEEKKEPVAAETARVDGEGAAANPAPTVAPAAVEVIPVTASAVADKPPEKAPEAPPAAVVEAAAQRSGSGHLARAAVVATAIGLGWMGGWATSLASGPDGSTAGGWLAATLGASAADQGEMRQLAGDVQALKAGLDEVRGSLERSREDETQRLAQLGERLEAFQKADRDGAAQMMAGLQRAEQATATKLASLAERFDKLERPERDPSAQLTKIAERLDRMERQLAAAPSAAAKPLAVAANDPAQTNAIAEAKPAQIENWALRDVYNGVALIEGKNRRLVEIVPGQNLPGVGRVKTIERRGRTWIVVTTGGIITSQAW